MEGACNEFLNFSKIKQNETNQFYIYPMVEHWTWIWVLNSCQTNVQAYKVNKYTLTHLHHLAV